MFFGGAVTRVAAAPGQVAIALQQSEARENWTELAFVDLETGAATRLSLNEPFDQVKLSADGARAATRSWLKSDVAIWDTATGELLRRIAAKGDIAGLTPDGERLLMDYRSLIAFDVATGEPVAELGDAAGVWSIIREPYGDALITLGQIGDESEHWGWSAKSGERLWRAPGDAVMTRDGAIQALHDPGEALWRVTERDSGRLIGAVPFPGEVMTGAILSDDGARLAATRRLTDADGNRDHVTELWDVAKGRRLWRKQAPWSGGPQPSLRSLSPDRAAYAYQASSKEKGLTSVFEIFDWMSGETAFEEQWPGFGDLRSLSVDRVSETLLIASGYTTALRDLSDGARLWSLSETFGRASAFSPDGAFIAVSGPLPSDKYRIAVLDRETGATRREWSLDVNVEDVAVTSDGRVVLAALKSDEWSGVRAWRVADGALAHEFELDGSPQRLYPLGDPSQLIVLDYQGAARAFDLRDGREARRFPMAIRAANGGFSADGARAVTVNGARIRFWDAITGEERDTMAAEGLLKASALSPDGLEVAFVSQRKRKARGGAEAPVVSIWRPETDEPIETLAAVDPRRLAYDPTGATLVIASGNDVVRLFDARTLAPRFTVAPLENGGLQTSGSDWARFTGDGRHLALRETGEYGQTNVSGQRAALRVFEVETGEEVARFDVHPYRSGLSATKTGFFYVDVKGRSRLFTPGVGVFDRVLNPGPTDELIAAPGAERVLVSNYWNGDALVDIRTGETSILNPKAEDEFTIDTAIDPSGRYIAIVRQLEEKGGGRSWVITVFDAGDGAALSRTPPLPMTLGRVDFAEGGETILVSQHTGAALIRRDDVESALFRWRWRDGSVEPLIDDNPVASYRVSADGAWLATSEGGENDDTGEVFGRRETRLFRFGDDEARVVRPHDLYGPSLVLSADGRRYGVFSGASPTRGEVIEIDEAGEVATLLEIASDDAAVFARPVGFTPDGRHFILGERSGARVYDLDAGTIRRLRVPGRAKRRVMSGDGAFLAIGGDTFVSVWDLRTFERVADLKVENMRLLTFAGADMRSLIATTEDGVVKLEWQAGALSAAACRIYRDDEWEGGRRRITATDAPEMCDEAPEDESGTK
ncbi:MAG: hypothetical protein AAF360_04880 [Pseudomonadota bacterium]